MRYRRAEAAAGGLNGGGQIGSGELMFDRDTGRRVTAADLVAMSRDRESVPCDAECDCERCDERRGVPQFVDSGP